MRSDAAISCHDTSAAAQRSNVDLREQLFNAGAIGKTEEVQVSGERIGQLNGIFFDVDPKLILPGTLSHTIPQDPHDFYVTIIRPMLDRHDVLQCAEVRNSGTGLHIILRFDDPVIFTTDAERDRWIGIVEVVQCALPIDPDSPHITSLTRPVGSVNSKKNTIVSMLTRGKTVSQADVIRLFDELDSTPFKAIAKIFFGAEKIKPCPICQHEGTQLSALNFVGDCYGSCGKVKIEQLFESVLAPRSQNVREGAAHDTTDE